MFLKLLWFLVLVWIVARVFRSARSLFHIASGRVEPPPRASWPPMPGPGPSPGPLSREPQRPSPAQPPAPNGPARRDDVEDARFEDL